MSDFDFAAWNAWVVNEFRATEGSVAGYEELPLLLLTTTGARSQQPVLTPLCYVRLADGYVVAAVNGGRPMVPGWIANLQADPRASIEVGAQSLPVRASVPSGEESAELWALFLRERPSYQQYVRDTPIPMAVFTPEPG